MKNKELKEKLDSVEFVDLMQAYRIASMGNQEHVINTFENVKGWILKEFDDYHTQKNKEIVSIIKSRIIVIENENNSNKFLLSVHTEYKHLQSLLNKLK